MKLFFKYIFSLIAIVCLFSSCDKDEENTDNQPSTYEVSIIGTWGREYSIPEETSLYKTEITFNKDKTYEEYDFFKQNESDETWKDFYIQTGTWSLTNNTLTIISQKEKELPNDWSDWVSTTDGLIKIDGKTLTIDIEEDGKPINFTFTRINK